MKLFLTSAGIVSETQDDFLKLIKKNPKELKLIFIPTASNVESDAWYVKKDKQVLAGLGFKDILDIDLANETQITLPEKLKTADIIYVEGGNTFYLLQKVRASGFAQSLPSFLERGGIYVGVSAGSIIAGPNIEPAAWKHADVNVVNLKDLSALNLVPFAITPHYCPQVAQAVTEAAAKVPYPAIALTDHQAICVNGAESKLVGPSPKFFFNNPKIS